MGRSTNRRQSGSRRSSDRSRSDHWTDKAKGEGYAARSVYKLQEIDERVGLVRSGARVVGVDISEVEGFPGTFLHDSVYDVSADEVIEALSGPADLVVSDMAPATTGARTTDHLRQVALAERALELATEILSPGGAFVAKVFDSADAPAFVDAVRSQFTKVRRVRPQASRTESREFFVVAQGYAPTKVPST